MDIGLSYHEPRRVRPRPFPAALLVVTALAVGAAGGAVATAWRANDEPRAVAEIPLCSQALRNLSSIALADAITHADTKASQGCRFSAPRGG
jgi:hypothetical protein